MHKEYGFSGSTLISVFDDRIEFVTIGAWNEQNDILLGVSILRNKNLANIFYRLKMNEFSEYKKRIGDRAGLYRSVSQAFQVKSALYPGSHIDIMPSFVIQDVTYIDNFKGTIKFFKEYGSHQ